MTNGTTDFDRWRRQRQRQGKGRRGFTLVELMVVTGLIAVLISPLLPVVERTRSASRGVACVSNLRQMGVAWTMYIATSRGRLMHYVWHRTGINVCMADGSARWVSLADTLHVELELQLGAVPARLAG